MTVQRPRGLKKEPCSGLGESIARPLTTDAGVWCKGSVYLEAARKPPVGMTDKQWWWLAAGILQMGPLRGLQRETGQPVNWIQRPVLSPGLDRRVQIRRQEPGPGRSCWTGGGLQRGCRDIGGSLPEEEGLQQHLKRLQEMKDWPCHSLSPEPPSGA